MRLPKNSSLLWKLMWLVAWVLKLFYCRLTVEGADNVPIEGGLVVACNHNPDADFVVLGFASPRQLYYMAKSEIFQLHPLLTRLLLGLGTFPVDRGTNDTAALGGAVGLLRQGYAIGMFPEGTRSPTGQLQRGRSGATRLAMSGGVPIVPAVVLNSELLFVGKPLLRKRPHLIVRFGAPFVLEGSVESPAAVRHNTDLIMRNIAALLPPERRGVYAESSEEPTAAKAQNDA